METSKLFLISYLLIFAGAKIFESVNEFKEYIEAESKIVEILETFVDDYRNNLKYLEAKLNYYKSENDKAIENPDSYTSNMLNTFTLTQRLTHGIEFIENRTVDVIDSFLNSMDDLESSKPIKITENDKIDIVRGILHLQENLDLKTEDLAKGKFPGKLSRGPLDSHDVFEIGNYLQYINDESKASEWYNAALKSLESEEFSDVTKLEIYEAMFINYWNNNKTLEALETNVRILEIDPHNEQANYMKKLFADMLNEDELEKPDFEMEL